MKTDARFWDRIAQRYSKQPIADEAAYQKKLQVTRDYLRPHMEVLEIGCGTGSTAIAHAPFVKHIRALDISANMIAIAKRKADAAGVTNVTFEQSSIDEMRVGPQTLDAVLALSILHLVENRDEVVSRLYAMLRPGGVLVSSTACLGDTMKYFKLIARLGRFLGVMPLVKVFSVKELLESLTRAQFEIDYKWQPRESKAVFIVAKRAP